MAMKHAPISRILRSKQSKFSVATALCAVIVLNPLQAKATVAAAFTGLFSLLSKVPAIAAIVSGTTTALDEKASSNVKVSGVVVAASGVITSIADPMPPSAFFTSGDFEIRYDPDDLELLFFGWLGPWGLDANLQAPPTDIALWGDESNPTTVVHQAPNASLDVLLSIDSVNGILAVQYEWESPGYLTTDSEPFNFFAATFQAKRDIVLSYLGDSGPVPVIGSNFYISTKDVSCLIEDPSGNTFSGQCGEPSTQYYATEPYIQVPGPLTPLGVGAAFGSIRKLRRFSAQLKTFSMG